MKTSQKIISVFLVVVFLLSTLGFTINKMVCLKSGKTKISFMHVTDCCNKKNTQTRIKSNCCDLKNSSFNLDDFSVSPKTNVPFAITAILPIWQENYIPVASIIQTPALLFADLPPPLHGRQLLSFISILII